MTDDTTGDLFDEGARGRDEGIRRAEEHATAVMPGAPLGVTWPELAAFYLDTALGGALKRFQTTDFRKWAEARGLPKPPDPRAYGGVIRRAVKAGKIIADGYAQKGDGTSHNCPAVVWKVA